MTRSMPSSFASPGEQLDAVLRNADLRGELLAHLHEQQQHVNGDDDINQPAALPPQPLRHHFALKLRFIRAVYELEEKTTADDDDNENLARKIDLVFLQPGGMACIHHHHHHHPTTSPHFSTHLSPRRRLHAVREEIVHELAQDAAVQQWLGSSPRQ